MFVFTGEKKKIKEAIAKTCQVNSDIIEMTKILKDRVEDLEMKIDLINEKLDEIEKIKADVISDNNRQKAILKDMSIIQNYSLNEAYKGINS